LWSRLAHNNWREGTLHDYQPHAFTDEFCGGRQ
jgi:hypothetical protein